MKKFPEVTIAIPVLNEERNIVNCLNSIKKQDYKGKIVVYIVDNGCTDRTIPLAKKFKFVKVVKNTVNDYLIAKMMGLKAAKGKYFTYLDADIDLPTKKWVTNMVRPLEEDETIFASTTGFVSYKSDPPLNKYLTLDTIQRDPLFVYLTPDVKELTTEKLKHYDIMTFKKNRILPMGLCLYRVKQLLAVPEIAKRDKFHELDNLVILLKKGYSKYAYVEDAGLHHLTVPNLKVMISKRIRNLRKTFFAKGEKHYWNWIDTSDRSSITKLVIWVLYAESIILPTLYGIYRSLKHKTWLGMYEPIVVWLTTNSILYIFLTSSGGRTFIKKLMR